jgi:hypothetical protein
MKAGQMDALLAAGAAAAGAADPAGAAAAGPADPAGAADPADSHDFRAFVDVSGAVMSGRTLDI